MAVPILFNLPPVVQYAGRVWRGQEYVGDDLDADLAAMAADPDVQSWWTLTDAMQEPYPERGPGDWWLTVSEVFHVD